MHVASGHEEAASRAPKEGADVGDRYETAFYAAAREGDEKVVASLLETQSELIDAVHIGNEKLLKLLFKSEFLESNDNWSAFHLAAEYGNERLWRCYSKPSLSSLIKLTIAMRLHYILLPRVAMRKWWNCC